MSIKITAEELTNQHLNGKSIKQLSLETGKGEWAIRKQIQRYLKSQKVSQESLPVYQEQPAPVSPKQKPFNKFAAVLAAIGFMVTIYFIYLEIKKRRNNPSN